MTSNSNYRNLFLTILIIVVIGSILLYSASSSFAFYKFNKSDSYFFIKHLIWFLIGMVGLLFFSKLNYKHLKNNSKKILYFSWVIISIPLIQKIFLDGDNVARWLKVGNFSLMTTSDLGKLCLIIFTCSFIDKNYNKINDVSFMIRNFIPYVFVSLFLILYQPDLSTTIVLALIIFSLLYLAGINNKIILMTISFGLISIITILSFYQIAQIFGIEISNYQQKRLIGWIKTFSDSGTLDQSYFSILALANGGFLGSGLGDSVFKYNGFIPEGQTDFILAIIGEEIGFLGVLLIFTMFIILFYQGFNISRNCNDRFSMFLSLGIVINIFIYLLINSSYVIGILPTTGLPIPFISYGGSQTIFTLLSIGILLNISKSNIIYKRHNKFV